MKEIPILFSTPMVQAILEGRKSMTRRMAGLDNINEDPNQFEFVRIQYYDDCCKAVFENKNTWNTHIIKCSYGQPEDLLWVRETWCLPSLYDGFEKDYYFKAGFNPTVIDNRNASQSWRPSIHRPKAAARIWLQVEEIRVERLQDITDDNARREGVEFSKSTMGNCYLDYINGGYNIMTTSYKSFRSLWRKINGPESWDANPWVWVVEFKVLSTNGKPVPEREAVEGKPSF